MITKYAAFCLPIRISLREGLNWTRGDINSRMIFFLIFFFSCLVFEFIFLNDSVYSVVNRQIFQFGGIVALIKDQFKPVVLRIGDLMALVRWYRWRGENWVNSNSRDKGVSIKGTTYFNACSIMVGISRAR